MSVRWTCWAEGSCAELEGSRESLGFITYKVGAPCPELHGAEVKMDTGSVSSGVPPHLQCVNRKSLAECRRTCENQKELGFMAYCTWWATFMTFKKFKTLTKRERKRRGQ